MKYTEQLFDGIFDDFLEKRKTTYLKDKITTCNLSHFAKTFAVEFYNEKTKHLDFKEIESNYKNGQNDALLLVINRLDKLKLKKENELNDYKQLKNATKKGVEILENGIYEISNCKLIVQSIYKSKQQ